MTLGVAWISKDGEGEELWIASDSRLLDSESVWDNCPKLISLPRRDAVAGFSGSTAEAYPLLLQFANTIGCYRAAADGTLEFSYLVAHLERVVNAMMSGIEADRGIIGQPRDEQQFATHGDTLILGGYSRAQGAMILRALRYQPPTNSWRFQHIHPRKNSRFGPSRTIVVFGDHKSRSRFLYLLHLYLEERGRLKQDITFKLEPLAVIAAMLRLPQSSAPRIPMDRRPRTIGGAPQVLRVFPGAQATALAVQWETERRSGIFLQGRQTFTYEHLDVPLISFNDFDVNIHAPGRWPENAIRS